MGIYQRDNLSSSLASALQSALDRHQRTTERQNAYTASNTNAITGLMKSVGRAYEMKEEDELKKKLAELQKERNAAATAIADGEAAKSLAVEKRNAEILDAYERAKEAKALMEGYRPGYSTNEYWDAMSSSANMNNYRPGLLRQPQGENMPMRPSFQTFARYQNPYMVDYDTAMKGVY